MSSNHFSMNICICKGADESRSSEGLAHTNIDIEGMYYQKYLKYIHSAA